MFAPSINVDFEKLRGEEATEEEPAPKKAKVAAKGRASARKAVDDKSKD